MHVSRQLLENEENNKTSFILLYKCANFLACLTSLSYALIYEKYYPTN